MSTCPCHPLQTARRNTADVGTRKPHASPFRAVAVGGTPPYGHAPNTRPRSPLAKAASRDRTGDFRITRAALCRLSYCGVPSGCGRDDGRALRLHGPSRIRTCPRGFSVRCAYRLHHRPVAPAAVPPPRRTPDSLHRPALPGEAPPPVRRGPTARRARGANTRRWPRRGGRRRRAASAWPRRSAPSGRYRSPTGRVRPTAVGRTPVVAAPRRPPPTTESRRRRRHCCCRRRRSPRHRTLRRHRSWDRSWFIPSSLPLTRSPTFQRSVRDSNPRPSG